VGCSIKWAYKQASGEAEMERYREGARGPRTGGPRSIESAAQEYYRQSPAGGFLGDLVRPVHRRVSGVSEDVPHVPKAGLRSGHGQRQFPRREEGRPEVPLEQHASTKNLLFGTDQTYDQMAAFDPEWNAGVPYTMLIGIDGQTIYKKQGEIDPLEVRRLILANLPDDDYIGQQAYWSQAEARP
jgi:hypothetical protein